MISSAKAETLSNLLRERFGEQLQNLTYDHGDVTAVLTPAALIGVATALRDEPAFSFKLLIDVSGVDYQTYGKADGIDAERTATERAILDCVRELRAAGMTVRAIAAELDRLGHRTRKGGSIAPTQVARLIKAA